MPTSWTDIPEVSVLQRGRSILFSASNTGPSKARNGAGSSPARYASWEASTRCSAGNRKAHPFSCAFRAGANVRGSRATRSFGMTGAGISPMKLGKQVAHGAAAFESHPGSNARRHVYLSDHALSHFGL